MQGLVAAGVGVALIPELALTNVRDDIVIRSLDPQSPVRRVIAATANGAADAPAAVAMLEILKSETPPLARGRPSENLVS